MISPARFLSVSAFLSSACSLGIVSGILIYSPRSFAYHAPLTIKLPVLTICDGILLVGDHVLVEVVFVKGIFRATRL